MKVSFQNKILFLFLIILIIIISVSKRTLNINNSLLKTNELVSNNLVIINELGNILTLSQNLQIESRGFAITNDLIFRNAYNNYKISIDSSLNNLKILVANHSNQNNRTLSLITLIRKRISISEELINARKKLSFIEADKIIGSSEVNFLNNEIKNTIKIMVFEETIIMKMRQDNNVIERDDLLNSVMFFLIFLIITLFVSYFLIRHNINIRNKTESALNLNLKTIANFRVLFEEAPGSFLILLPDFTIDAVSDNYLLVTKTIREEIMGKNIFQAFPNKFNYLNPTNAPLLTESLNVVLKYKVPDQMELQTYTTLNTDGTYDVRYLSPLNKAILDENNNVVYLIHSVEDITSQILYEKQLQDASEEITTLYNQAPCGYLSMNTNNDFITNINETLLNWIGYSAEEVVGKMKYRDLFSPKSLELNLKSFTENFTKLFELGYVNDLEFELQRKDKTTFDAIIDAVVIKNDKGEIVKIHSTVFDNTENKINQDKLKEHIKEISDYKYALDEASIVAVTDNKGIIKHVNDNFCNITKYTREELIGNEHRILNSGYHSPEFFGDFWKTLFSGKLWRGEVKNKAKDGSFFWFYTTVIPFIDENGKPFQFTSIILDITERKHQEELLLSQAEELIVQQEELKDTNSILEVQSYKLKASEEELKAQQEELVASNQDLEEKTQLLEERNHSVIEKNEELEATSHELQLKAEELILSSKYKSEFLANMSHELRTPLNSILLLSKLLSDNDDGNLSMEQKEFASVINNSGNNLLQLINEILDLSKIESGNMPIEIENIDLNDILKNINNTFIQLAKQKGIHFSSKIEETTPVYFNTDNAKVEQVMNNFLSNAFKFTQKGSVELIIRKPNEFEVDKMKINPDDFISFEVKDSGIGIPADKQSLVFEAFQQADGSTRRQFGGTGLGLAISREIAHLLGGEIILKSELDKGSSFTLILPLDLKQNKFDLGSIIEPENYVLTHIKNSMLSKTPFDKDLMDFTPNEIDDDRFIINENDKVILIVEDDFAFAKVLKNQIHDRGYKAIVAVSGADALSFAIKYKPIGILLDIKLPGKSGWSVLKELKKNNEVKYIPIHMMSALQTMQNDIISAVHTDFVKKPFVEKDLNLIFDKIESVTAKLSKIILLIENNDTHSLEISNFISSTYKKCIVANNAIDAIEILNTENIDSVIIDFESSPILGYKILETMKIDSKLESIPIIVFKGKSMVASDELKIKQFAGLCIMETAGSIKKLTTEISNFLKVVETKDENKTANKPYFTEKALANKHVLIVDDDARNIFSLTKVLENHKMKVSSASDGNEALDLLKNKNDIELILMDMMMPNKDGYQTIEEIRKDLGLVKIPIIAVTAKAMLGDREKCIDVGANDYVTKPVDTERLLSLLKVWLYNN